MSTSSTRGTRGCVSTVAAATTRGKWRTHQTPSVRSLTTIRMNHQIIRGSRCHAQPGSFSAHSASVSALRRLRNRQARNDYQRGEHDAAVAVHALRGAVARQSDLRGVVATRRANPRATARCLKRARYGVPPHQFLKVVEHIRRMFDVDRTYSATCESICSSGVPGAICSAAVAALVNCGFLRWPEDHRLVRSDAGCAPPSRRTA